MPDDAIGQLGLDTEPFKKAVREAVAELQKLNTAQDRTNNTVRGFFAGIGAVYILSHLKALGQAITGLGERAEKAVEQFQRGGSRLEANTPNQGMSSLSMGLKPIIEDKSAQLKNNAVSAGGGIMGVLGAMYIHLTQGKEAMDDYMVGLDAVEESGNVEKKVREGIAFEQDKVADAMKKQIPDLNSQLGILEKQLIVEEKKLKLADLETIEGREIANQAKATLGQLRLQYNQLLYNQERTNIVAMSETRQMQTKQQGMKNIAEMIKIEADYTARITQARREGNSVLMNELAMQRDMAMNQAKVNEHNLTTNDLLTERSGARKFERDLSHQQQRDADMLRRASGIESKADAGPSADFKSIKGSGVNMDAVVRHGAYGATHGSRMDRFRRRQQEGQRAKAVQMDNMTVKGMTVENMIVNNPPLN